MSSRNYMNKSSSRGIFLSIMLLVLFFNHDIPLLNILFSSFFIFSYRNSSNIMFLYTDIIITGYARGSAQWSDFRYVFIYLRKKKDPLSPDYQLGLKSKATTFNSKQQCKKSSHALRIIWISLFCKNHFFWLAMFTYL